MVIVSLHKGWNSGSGALGLWQVPDADYFPFRRYYGFHGNTPARANYNSHDLSLSVCISSGPSHANSLSKFLYTLKMITWAKSTLRQLQVSFLPHVATHLTVKDTHEILSHEDLQFVRGVGVTWALASCLRLFQEWFWHQSWIPHMPDDQGQIPLAIH